MSEEHISNVDKGVEQILEERYLLPGETPEEMMERVAEHVAGAEETEEKQEEWEEKFGEILKSLNFLPNSPTLMNAGTELGQLSACFVLPVEDDMASIFETQKNAALVHQSGGGTGFSFSKLREKGADVGSTGGVASGPLTFMDSYDAATQTVKQGGKRRGANMGSLSVHHPDILEFIEAKQEGGRLENFNLSVEVTDKFMEAVRDGEEYELRSPTGRHPNDPKNVEVVDTLDAEEVMELIAKCAHESAEPGVLFIDTHNEDYPFPAESGDVHYLHTTNPCGELSLEPYDACNLGHINLSTCLDDGEVDWDEIHRRVKIGIRFLDNVINVNQFPLEKIHEKVESNRRIGLGIMGWHEMLMKLGIPYDSEEAVHLADELSRFIYEEARDYSQKLGMEKGSFPNKDESLYVGPMRNATLLTAAPTGTTSTLAGTTGGIEPIPFVESTKEVMDGKVMDNTNKTVRELLEEGGEPNEGLLKTAQDIDWKWHIEHQAAWQEGIDASISKTVSLSKDAGVGDVEGAIVKAWDTGCKGITVYRDGTLDAPIQDANAEEDEKEENGSETVSVEQRPRRLEGATYREKVGCGHSLYCSLTKDGDEEIQEVFATIGKSGACIDSFAQGIGRLASLYLRAGGDGKEVVETLRGIRCPEPVWDGPASCVDAVSMMVEEELNAEIEVDEEVGTVKDCPECGGPLDFSEGCRGGQCFECGWSKC